MRGSIVLRNELVHDALHSGLTVFICNQINRLFSLGEMENYLSTCLSYSEEKREEAVECAIDRGGIRDPEGFQRFLRQRG